MHGNAPLTPEGRRRLVVHVTEDERPIAHVAAEAGIARQTLSKWLDRYRDQGEQGLPEFVYARTWNSETERTQWLHRWNIHYNYHRAHTALGNQPPASAVPHRVTNLQMQNT